MNNEEKKPVEAASGLNDRVRRLARPDCFEFAMCFLGDPERTEVARYVERLEHGLKRIIELNDSEMADGDGAREIAEETLFA